MSTNETPPATSIAVPDTMTTQTRSTVGTHTNNSTSSSGRGTDRNRHRGGRGRGRGNNNNRNRTSTANRQPTTSFKGNTDGMKGNVFQSHGENKDKQQFLKSVGVLEEYINKTFTYPQDVASVCTLFELTTLTQPANLTAEE